MGKNYLTIARSSMCGANRRKKKHSAKTVLNLFAVNLFGIHFRTKQ